MAGGPHPIPSRTRSLSPLAPMVLRLKAWESRSLPGPQSPVIQTCRHIFPLRRFWSRLRPAARIFLADLSGPRGRICISGVSLLNVDNADAGWSSPVARQAHNLKVVGSNPTPAPNKPLISSRISGAFPLVLVQARLAGMTATVNREMQTSRPSPSTMRIDQI